MSGHRLRVRIVGVAVLGMVLASGVGIGRADSSEVADPEPEPAQPSERVRPVQVTGVLPTDRDGRPRPEKIVLAPPEPDEKKQEKPRDADGKVIYLTFDDGPTVPYTNGVLRMLDRYDATATFFQTGENASRHPELTRAVVARGHALGSHTWDHRDLRGLKTANVNRQITRTSAVLSLISGRKIRCLRPPFGAVNGRVKKAIRRHQLEMKLWDIDPRDWKRPGADAIASRVLFHADPGDVSLMHDGGGKRGQSVAALGRILRTLHQKGYRFEAMPGC